MKLIEDYFCWSFVNYQNRTHGDEKKHYGKELLINMSQVTEVSS